MNRNDPETEGRPSDDRREEDWPSEAYGWYVVTILIIAYIVAFIDRQLLTLLVEPIRADLNISDTQFGLLQGFAFALLYAIAGIPIARYGDRASRRNIIIIGVAVWSLATAMCGLARSFAQLFIARVAVGVGEAALSPQAYSLLADLFPPHRLARATGAYSLSIYVGSGLALILGGALIEMLSAPALSSLPLIGGIAPWQRAFVLTGLLGIPVALLLFTIAEPARRGAIDHGHSKERASVRELPKATRRHLGWALAGFTMFFVVVVGLLAWVPTYFVRLHNWSIGTVGLRFGLLLAIGGSVGSLAAGALADRWQRLGKSAPHVRAGLLFGTLSLPSAIFAPLVTWPIAALLLFGLTLTLLSGLAGLSAALVQVSVPNRLRGQTTAMFFLVTSLVGTAGGPLFVALLNDYIFGSESAIGLSVATMSGLCGILGVLALARCLTIKRVATEF